MASRNASFHEGVLGRVLLTPLKLLLALVIALAGVLILAWGIDWIFVNWVWRDRVDHLVEIVRIELTRGVALANLQGRAPESITAPVNALYEAVFRTTGLHEMGERFADGAELSIPDTIMRNFWIAHREEVEIAMVGTQLLGVRAASLTCFIPLLLLLYFIATADGLAQRAIRRAGGGRESANLYHRAKHTQVAVLSLGIAGVLVCPASVCAEVVGGLLSCVAAILARSQWAYYKKHF